jgi:hypothetical protein
MSQNTHCNGNLEDGKPFWMTFVVLTAMRISNVVFWLMMPEAEAKYSSEALVTT